MRVATLRASCSTSATWSKPAAPRPMARPPAPAKRSMQLRAAAGGWLQASGASPADIACRPDALEVRGGAAMTPVTWPPAPPTSSKRPKGTMPSASAHSVSDQFQAVASAASRTPRSVLMPVSPNQLAPAPIGRPISGLCGDA